MQMEYRLPRPRPDVVHRAVSVLDAALAPDLRRYELAVAKDLGVFWRGFLQSDDVPLGEDEHVSRRFGVDVLEGEHLVVLVNLLRGNLPGDNFAKETVVHGSMLSDEKH